MLRYYFPYLCLSAKAIALSCMFHFSYLKNETLPQGSFRELASNVFLFVLACVVAIVLLNLQFNEKEQYTPNSFCSKRCMMAAGMICINILLTGNSIFSLYCSWTNAIIEAVIISILYCLVYIILKLAREEETPIRYRLSKTTTVTMSQNLFMILFLTVFGAFNICSSSIELRQFPDEYTELGFFYTTRYICPALYFITIPVVYVAFLAYNSEELEFSGLEPTSGRIWYGVCRWNEKLGEWEHVETIRGKTKSLVLIE